MPPSHAHRPRVSLIAAVADNGVIGSGGAIPWHLSDDLKRFRALTIGHPIVMGRRTHESLGRPLPGRRNIVLTREASYHAAGCECVASLQQALDACRDADEVFVIGGAEIYAQALPVADRLHMTEIHAEFAGDTRFPDYDRDAWREVRRDCQHSDAGWDYDFVIYERA